MGHPNGGRSDGVAVRRAVLASLIGTSIEWYDFILYGTAAAIVFNTLFFPEQDPLVGTLAAFATFAVGFIVRPLGAVVFGHLGDRVGRKSMLVVTLSMMGGATFVIGLLPTYDSIGVAAPALLVVCRIVQGISAGGEWGGAVLMATEHAPPGRRGFYGSWPQMGVPVGLALANVLFALAAALPDEQFLAWGWRVPFLLSIVLVAVGLFVRLRVLETPVFARVKQAGAEARLPVVEVLRSYPRTTLLAMGMRAAENMGFVIWSTFVLTYATAELDIPRSLVLSGVVAAAVLAIVTIPMFAALSDRVGRRPVYLAGAVFTVLYAFPFFWLVETRNPVLVWLAVVLGIAGGHAAMYGPQAAYFCELFGTRVRYSGIALAYGIPSIFVGGLAPLIATALLSWSGGASWPIAVYLLAMGAVSVLSVALTGETYRTDIEADRHGERPAAVGDAAPAAAQSQRGLT